jgi:hypothetical protein
MTTTTVATPWVEKYRPRSLDDVSHQTEIIATLTNAVETNRLPHLLFYGPPGVRAAKKIYVMMFPHLSSRIRAYQFIILRVLFIYIPLCFSSSSSSIYIYIYRRVKHP